MGSPRKAVSKRVRFEVFKRDSFKCQYCGASSPDVVLQLDHIHPVAEGGDNDITNLVTSCDGCNAGKSDKLLSDTAAASKRKAQLDQLQERREQLEMMAAWQRGLLDMTDAAVKEAADIWKRVTERYPLNENGLATLRKHILKFGFTRVAQAIVIAAKYFERGKDGYTQESIERGWGKVGGICVVQQWQQEDPELHEIYKIRAMLMNRAPSLQPWDITRQLNSLRQLGFTAPEIRTRMEKVYKWYQFKDVVDEMTEEVQ